MAIKRNLQLGFEAIEDGEGTVGNNVEVTDGIDVDTVVEAGEGGQEVGALDADIQTVTSSIEDMLAVEEGLGEEQTAYAEQIETNPTEVTGDTVVAAMESLTSAIAISGIDFTKSSMGFEAIGDNPLKMLNVALEDYKDFFKRLWVQIKEFFKKLMLGFKKIFTAVMKWTAADVDACDKLIKKIKEGGEIAAISQKDGTIFKSTKTKVQRSLAGYLAAVNHKDISGAGFVTGMTAVLALANDTAQFAAMTKVVEKVEGAKEDSKPSFDSIGMQKIDFANFSEQPKDVSVLSQTVNSSGVVLCHVDEKLNSGSTKLTVKSDFTSGIKVENIGAKELEKVLYGVKKYVQDNKKYFDLAEKSIDAIEKRAEGFLKSTESSDESLVKWARIGAKIAMRLSKNGIYDSVLGQIRVNKAVLSVCKTIATGKADKEETK